MTPRRVLVVACLVGVAVELARPVVATTAFGLLDRPSRFGISASGATYLTAALALVAALAVRRDHRGLRTACAAAGTAVAVVGVAAAVANPFAAYTTGLPDPYFVLAGLGPALVGGLAAAVAVR